MKSQCVQECTESFHHQKYSNSGTNKDDNANDKDNYIVIPAADGPTMISSFVKQVGKFNKCNLSLCTTKLP